MSAESGEFTATRQPRLRAAPIIASASARRVSVHILVRKLKLSSMRTSAEAGIPAMCLANASGPGSNVASKKEISCPACRRSAAVSSVVSGG